MPVSDQVRVSSHTGNGVTTVFAYGFRILVDTDLLVTVDGIVQTLTTDYTVTGAGDAGGGTVVFITAPISLAVVTISGNTPFDRTTDYIQNGDLRAETLDNDFDKTTMLIQDNRRDIARSIKLPVEDTTDQVIDLTAAQRADKVLSFDAAGNVTASTLTDLSSVFSTVDTSLVLGSGILSVAIPNRQALATGTVDAITAVFSPVIAALANNVEVVIEASGANTIVAPTFTPDGLATKDIVKGNDTPLAVADIPGANYRAHLVFDATLDKWILLNPASIVDLKTAQTIAGKKTFSNNVIFTKGADVASAAALPIIADGNYFDVTGTTAITTIDTVGIGVWIKLHFDGVLTLTHHASNLSLPGAANIITAAGDEAEFVEYDTGKWRCSNYTRADGTALAITGVIGAPASKSSGTDYQATTDGFVVGWLEAGDEGDRGSFLAYTDSASTPTTIVQKGSADALIGAGFYTFFAPIMFPVKKNDYYRVDISNHTGVSTVTMNFIPLGS